MVVNGALTLTIEPSREDLRLGQSGKAFVFHNSGTNMTLGTWKAILEPPSDPVYDYWESFLSFPNDGTAHFVEYHYHQNHDERMAPIGSPLKEMVLSLSGTWYMRSASDGVLILHTESAQQAGPAYPPQGVGSADP